MNTILSIFIISLVISTLMTPVAQRLGIKFGAIDMPRDRKVHLTPIPRSGGLAILSAFLLTLVAVRIFLPTQIAALISLDRGNLACLAGAVIVFSVGFFDDFHRLSPKVKFLFQIIGASVAFWGGIRIDSFYIFDLAFHFGFVLDYLITVFWFLLFINAINLIDGLDGLAAGVVFFTCVVMIILSVMRANYFSAVYFAALGGSVLGFLRYNFNPASIFMGDGGSYFLGYIIASLSIIGSSKSQVSATMLIPLIALGIPIFDTILSPIRRFLTGRFIFQADRGHIHHRLIDLGLSTRRVVFLIYGLSIALCGLSILVVNARNREASLLLVILVVGAVIFIRKLGYLDYLAFDKAYGWFKDVTDVAGLTRERRTFLGLQMTIEQSEDIEELWRTLCRAFELLSFDQATLLLHGKSSRGAGAPHLRWTNRQDSSSAQNDDQANHFLKIEFPLIDVNNRDLGTLFLQKEIRHDPLTYYTLRRVESLRRVVIKTLSKINSAAAAAL